MSPMHVELFFDFSCPYAYLASTRIEALCAAAGAELTWRPMLLGGVFRSLWNGPEPMARMGPAKARHTELDMQRWAARWGVPLRRPAAHPMRTVRALRALLAVDERHWPALIHGVYRAYWQRGDDITDPGVVRAVLTEAGLGPESIARAMEAHDDPAIKEELRRRTEEAVSRGVFGAPTMFVHRDDAGDPLMFWGQDRLHLVEAALAGWRPGHGPAPRRASTPTPSAAEREAEARPTLHFWYDFSSPFAYLAATQIEAVAANAGARLVWQPMLLGAVFKQIGTANVPLFDMPEAKRRYMNADLGHWASYWGQPFRFASRFPMRTVTALRLALLAGDRIGPLSLALFRALWTDDRDIDDADTLADILTKEGFDAAAMLAGTQDPALKQRLIDQTTTAVEAGVFGAPTTIIEPAGAATTDTADRLYWGQDRLNLVEDRARELARAG
ncbi:2-hydroxychromene-2-carboxylate isomerase [Haliangium sp.]|uniref:2-hydroxychromene-2-carboxylate isomerase n=1 Tax=Haliangium sp. TaxID=2663208 RepID=UPI003D0EE302